MFFSIIVPLYNRPTEIQELLKSLLSQSYTNFEVIVVEDGSNLNAKGIVESYANQLDVRYYFKDNEGQGFARNYGFERSKGDFLIVFDSDVLVPNDYLAIVKEVITHQGLDAFGGPDAAHESFSAFQKAISYCMTSPFTTGGIRGNKRHVGQFHPRSFNMGISRDVWNQTQGFKLSRRSEDIEFSIRMINLGYKVELIPEAFVYHKRRTNIRQFFKQIFGFGMGRIEISRLYPAELKMVHALPAVFTVAVLLLLLFNFIKLLFPTSLLFFGYLARFGDLLLSVYFLLLFFHALVVTKSFKVSLLAIPTAFVQLFAYGLGFLSQYIKVLVGNKGDR